MFLITNFTQSRDCLTLLPAMLTASERGVAGSEFANRVYDGCAAERDNAGNATVHGINFDAPV